MPATCDLWFVLTLRQQTLYTPHVDFNITQISLSPEGKFLAVAGVHQLAIVILPRPTYSRLPTADVECR